MKSESIGSIQHKDTKITKKNSMVLRFQLRRRERSSRRPSSVRSRRSGVTVT